MAKQLCDAGKVKVNSKVAKPATEVCMGDLIEGETGWEQWQIKVLQIPKGPVPSHLRSKYVEFLKRQRVSLREDEWSHE